MEPDALYRIRHSLAHVLAQAVTELRPGTKLGFGPPIDDGFYYDFILPTPLTEADFPELEKRMRRILSAGEEFIREELPKEEALGRIDSMGEPYKREYAEELIAKQSLRTLSFYRSGPFLDMCEGPHVEKTSRIPPDCFRLRSLAGAYWRGDSRNVMMTRVYAWAFANKEELTAAVRAYELAQERDHKKLGRELELFAIDDEIGKGLALWFPNGAVIRDEIEKLMKDWEFELGYQRVYTPHVAKEGLYLATGHLPYYAEGMYPPMTVKEGGEIRETYYLKPMNCPHHHRIFAARPRSYRELPLRLAEYGTVYRFEDSGALSGLLRVRSICQNDAHIYCTPEQAAQEFLAVMELHRRLYDLIGFRNYYMRFSTWDPDDPKTKQKYVDDPVGWEKAQTIVREAMKSSRLDFVECKGEAAFYGPKIDFQIKTVTGREETASTNQLDFGVPKRIGLKYVGADNAEHVPYVIHRAPAGAHERFAAFLIEHFGGAFPTWLAPIQARVIAVSEKFQDYAERIVADLRRDRVRAELDPSNETMGKKIRAAAKLKIPNVVIVGEREKQEGTVTLRRHGLEEQKTLPLAELRAWMAQQIRDRAQNPR